MRCPACHAELSAGGNFCAACGGRLPAGCARCGGTLPSGARFCPACGTPVDSGSASVVTRPVADPAPTPQPPASTEAELRLVTVLFADVQGFTALAERLPPDDVAELMNRCFDAIIPQITRFGGTVDKYVGDAVMARFGAPVAHEDDPERAIHAALGMQRELARLGTELAAELGAELRMRVGVNTGPVLAGEVGAAAHREYTLMGDAVNVAARLEQACPPGGILVGEATYRLAWRAFRFDPPQPLRFKGKSATVNAHPVLGEADAEAALGVGRAAPLVGRASELALLSDAARQAAGGRGQVVLVVGEAGVGKSRLLDEARSRLEAAGGGLRFAVARCQSYRQNLPYAALGQLVRSAAGLEVVADERSTVERLDGWLRHLLATPNGSDRLTLARGAFRDLLGLAGPDDEQIEPRQRRARLTRAFGDVVARLAEAAPLALVVEDLHWVDESSLDVLDDLVDDLPGLPVLLLALSRPERLPPWGSRSWYCQVTLRPLQAEQGRELLGALLAGWDVSVDLARQLLDRTEGNPFFIEEVVASLRESGALRPVDGRWALAEAATADLPKTVQGVLLARIDRLERPARAVLQTAAVIGRTFDERLLRAVRGADGGLDDALTTLRRHELLYRQALVPEPRYTFKHAITQEVAYATLPRGRRRELHLAVADRLEAEGAGRDEPPHALLAHHLLQAEAPQRALPHLLEAAGRAKRRYANDEALALFGQGLGILERAAGGRVAGLDPRAARLASFDLLSERHGVLGGLSRLDEERADLEAMRRLAEAEGDDRRLSDALNGLADSYNRGGDLPATRAAAEAALAIKARLGDRAGEADALSNIAPLYTALGDFEAAQVANRRALRLREEIGDEQGQIRSLDNLGLNYLFVGVPTEAQPYFQQALQRARAIAYKSYELQATIHLVATSVMLGTAVEGRAWAEQALALARETGDRAGEGWTWCVLGGLERDDGREAAAEEAFGRALELARAIGSTELEVRTLNWSAGGLALAGRPAEALERFEQAAERAELAGFALDVVDGLSGSAAAALELGRPERARDDAERAAALMSGMNPDVFYEGPAITWRLYRVFRALDDPRAERFREQARDVLERRAEAITDPGRRRAFLRRPLNRAIAEGEAARPARPSSRG